MKVPDQVCATCRWWDHDEEMGLIYAECRAKPPRKVTQSGKALWPLTDAPDWCGAWTKQP